MINIIYKYKHLIIITQVYSQMDYLGKGNSSAYNQKLTFIDSEHIFVIIFAMYVILRVFTLKWNNEKHPSLCHS